MGTKHKQNLIPTISLWGNRVGCIRSGWRPPPPNDNGPGHDSPF